MGKCGAFQWPFGANAGSGPLPEPLGLKKTGWDRISDGGEFATDSLESVDTDEVVSYLDELLTEYSSQLSDEDKESILSSVQEKFGLSEGDSLLNVTA